MRQGLIRPIICMAFILGTVSTAHAANWLSLQGTERPDAPAIKLWGFVQPLYSQTEGSSLKGGPWEGQPAVFNLMGPDLMSESTFQIRRARIGVRGQISDPINYFILTELGGNGVTGSDGGSAKLTDASITLNHIPGLRIRMGQFKTPGSEEGLQAIHTHDYINFSTVTDQLLLERFFDGDGADPADPNKPNGAVGAFRDIGLQLFDTFKSGDWEHSYAVMVGNGNGIARGDNDDKKELYGYLSTEWVFGGKGARREGLKFLTWIQDGKRTLSKSGAGQYDRTRYGAGITFRKSKYRTVFEYIAADGMIFNGTDGGAVPGSMSNDGTTVASFNIVPKDKARGWYADFGYRVIPKLELDIRYDELYRRTDRSTAEQKFKNLTLGVQYFFDKKMRLTVNHELRDAEAPNLSSSAIPNTILGGMDDRTTVQWLLIF